MNLSHALNLTPHDVVAFVGGGGKTTAMFRLADELAASMSVLTTTSTRIFLAQAQQAPAYTTFDPAPESIEMLLERATPYFDQHGQLLLIGQLDEAKGKAVGLASETIDALAATQQVGAIVIEADGSRTRPFKAPAVHEPVIPSSTRVVVPVVGIDVLGRPLTDEFVHRAEFVSHLSGTPIGQPVTVDTVAMVLTHPQGGLKHVPPAARVIPLINKTETPAERTLAVQLSRTLLTCSHIDSVLIGSVQNEATPIHKRMARTAAVILAAGGSSRFGSPKQLARWGDKTFIEHTVDMALASQVDEVIVVLGAEVEQSRALLADRPVTIVLNPDWAAGQSRSMQVGLAALSPQIDAALFMLVDLPGVDNTIVDSLIDRYHQRYAPLVWPEFEGRRGNPVLFDRRLFPELNQVRGDTGGRPVLKAYHDQAERVVVDEAGILQDIDRPEDLVNPPFC